MRGKASPPEFVRDEQVLWRHVVDGVLLSAPGSDDIITVKGAGAELWDLLATPHTPATAAQALGADFGRSPGEILAEIEPVLGELAARGVIRRVRVAEGLA